MIRNINNKELRTIFREIQVYGFCLVKKLITTTAKKVLLKKVIKYFNEGVTDTSKFK